MRLTQAFGSATSPQGRLELPLSTCALVPVGDGFQLIESQIFRTLHFGSSQLIMLGKLLLFIKK